ncbi:hypothetical protein EBQ81_00810 [bacterium]|nr:hypothetical protein [bacterium]
MWLTNLSLRFLMTRSEYACFKEALKFAVENNNMVKETKYIGKVKHLMSVNRSIKRIVEDGRDRDEVVDAVVHLAVALKYLEGKGRES